MLPASELLPLLDRLVAGCPVECEWRQWRIQPIAGGANNLIYRATSGIPTPALSVARPEPVSSAIEGRSQRVEGDGGAAHDLAIKWTIRDARDRAGREYAALAVLHDAKAGLAPEPLWLERERYAQPVVVQSWLAGDASAAPPADDAEWRALLDHYLAIHTLTPAHTRSPIQPAVLNMSSAGIGLQAIQQQLIQIPEPHQPASLQALLGQIARLRLPEWPAPPLAFCRVDPNIRNFIRRAGDWASVDWENSGWGDPAFEIADLITHPSYAAVPPERWEWLIAAYCAARDDVGAERRIRVYAVLMLAWWSARLARTLYEVPRGGDERLAPRSSTWQIETEALYQRYVSLAQAAISDRSALIEP